MARILIVDDSVTSRRILRKIFQDSKTHTVVAEAADGEEALLKYQKTLPDIVTMDVNMPVLDGVESVKNIMSQFPDANIIMISSVNDKEPVIKALRYGAKSYILKPVEENKLLETINSILEKSKK